MSDSTAPRASSTWSDGAPPAAPSRPTSTPASTDSSDSVESIPDAMFKEATGKHTASKAHSRTPPKYCDVCGVTVYRIERHKRSRKHTYALAHSKQAVRGNDDEGRRVRRTPNSRETISPSTSQPEMMVAAHGAPGVHVPAPVVTMHLPMAVMGGMMMPAHMGMMPPQMPQMGMVPWGFHGHPMGTYLDVHAGRIGGRVGAIPATSPLPSPVATASAVAVAAAARASRMGAPMGVVPKVETMDTTSGSAAVAEPMELSAKPARMPAGQQAHALGLGAPVHAAAHMRSPPTPVSRPSSAESSMSASSTGSAMDMGDSSASETSEMFMSPDGATASTTSSTGRRRRDTMSPMPLIRRGPSMSVGPLHHDHPGHLGLTAPAHAEAVPSWLADLTSSGGDDGFDGLDPDIINVDNLFDSDEIDRLFPESTDTTDATAAARRYAGPRGLGGRTTTVDPRDRPATRRGGIRGLGSMTIGAAPGDSGVSSVVGVPGVPGVSSVPGADSAAHPTPSGGGVSRHGARGPSGPTGPGALQVLVSPVTKVEPRPVLCSGPVVLKLHAFQDEKALGGIRPFISVSGDFTLSSGKACANCVLSPSPGRVEVAFTQDKDVVAYLREERPENMGLARITSFDIPVPDQPSFVNALTDYVSTARGGVIYHGMGGAAGHLNAASAVLRHIRIPCTDAKLIGIIHRATLAAPPQPAPVPVMRVARHRRGGGGEGGGMGLGFGGSSM